MRSSRAQISLIPIMSQLFKKLRLKTLAERKLSPQPSIWFPHAAFQNRLGSQNNGSDWEDPRSQTVLFRNLFRCSIKDCFTKLSNKLPVKSTVWISDFREINAEGSFLEPTLYLLYTCNLLRIDKVNTILVIGLTVQEATNKHQTFIDEGNHFLQISHTKG